MMKILVSILVILISIITISWVDTMVAVNPNAYFERLNFIALLIFMFLGLIFLLFNYSLCFASPILFKTAFVFGIIALFPTIYYHTEGPLQLLFRVIEVWQWIFCLMIGYVISHKGAIYTAYFINLLVLLILPIVGYYIYNSLAVNLLVGEVRTSDVTLILLVLFPFALQLKKESLKIAAIIFIAILAMLSFKRTVILGVVVMTVVHYFILMTKSKFSGLKTFLVSAIAIIALISLFLVFTYIDDQSGGYILHRLNNVQEDRGSGRLDVYNEIIRLFSESEIGEMLFGHGYMSVLKRVGMLAHNDFLEVIFDFGLIALTVYILFFLILLNYTRKMYRYRNLLDIKYQVFTAAIIAFIFLGMLNCFITSPVFYSTLMLYFGLSIGNYQRERIKFHSQLYLTKNRSRTSIVIAIKNT